MLRKNLFYTLMLCLVCFTTAACSPSLGTDDRTRTQGIHGNHIYNNPSGPYDDDKGFKNDFQRSDLNPNMVTGQNDLYNVNADARILSNMAMQFNGVRNARTSINGGTANVTINVANTTNQAQIKDQVYQALKYKMPKYHINVNVR